MQLALKPASPDAANKLLGLEALRFLTAFAILVFHYRHFAFVADKPVGLVPERLPLYDLLHPFHDSGAFGVWIFWCISGFIFFWKYRDAIAERSVGGWKFLVLRFSRLYPLHLVTLLLVALLQPVYFHMRGDFFVYQGNDLPHFLAQLFMASDWGIVHGYSFDGPIWSISVEVLVYFLFFLMLLATRSWLLNVAVIAACLCAVWLNASGQVTNCLAFFYIGGLAAMARRAIASTTFSRAIEGGAWLAVVVLPAAVLGFARDRLGQFDFQLLLTYTPILLFCLTRQIAMPAAVQKAVEAAGNMTYSSYLLHFPIQLLIVLGFAIFGAPIPLYDVTFFAIYLAITLLASYFAYRYFEAPAQNLVRSFFLRPRAAAPQTILGTTK
ncbi:acyltransferase family protein [Bradyrhizobium sp.]|uniref:acyltransferase family protein n=1 Tax=Bradyrhizobium sp. TaxID=376 RepID=UPI003C77255A